MYKKIIILGGSCSGKSTLANRISIQTHYPAYHLDHLLLSPSFEKKESIEYEKINKQLLSKGVGVIDSNFTDTIPERINWADLIIFIDVTTGQRLFRVLYRIIRCKLGLGDWYGKPLGTNSGFNMSFLSWVYHWNKDQKKKLLSMLESVKDKKVVIISRPRELDIENLLK